MEEQAARIERMEMMHRELREQMARGQDETKVQLERIMNMMGTILNEKGKVEDEQTNQDAKLTLGSSSKGEAAKTPAATLETVPKQDETIAGGHKEDLYIPVFEGFTKPSAFEGNEEDQKLAQLEERLKAIEGAGAYKNVDANKLSLVTGLVIPPKFKIPEFEKYEGKSCPVEHVTMYCRKMTAHTSNEKLMIHCFQDSLKGSALRWYNQLDSSRVHTWKDLAGAFIIHYKHMTDMAPDRISLRNLEKKSNESFRDYARRWREIANQVEPPLSEKESTVLFLETLKPPFYDRLVGTATRNFADLLMAGEMIENAVKNGKIETGEATKKGGSQKKKEEVQQISYQSRPNYQNSYRSYQARTQYQFTPQNNYPATQPTNTTTTFTATHTQNPNQNTNQSPQFDPIPMSYSQLYPQLLENRLVAPVFLPPRQPPYPKWYDASKKCEYHNDAVGHSIDNCTAFKYKVQNLVNAGALKFEKKEGPNVNANPLPHHADGKVNAIEDQKGGLIRRCIDKVQTPMEIVLKALKEVDWISLKENDLSKNSDTYCQYHGKHVGHTVQSCQSFRDVVQRMMNEGRIEFYVEKEEPMVASGEEEGKIKPLVVFYTVEEVPPPKTTQSQLVIQTPSSFPYKSDQAVPWNYGCNVKSATSESSSANISGIGGMTRSGRCYTSEMLKQARVEKAKVGENREENANEEVEEQLVKEPVSEKEAMEFLKFIKHSEYNVVDQLKKTPAMISVFELIRDSKPHRDALLNVLNQAYVPKDVTVEKLDRLVGNLTADNFISFCDDEIPPDGRGSTRALHITASCKGLMLSRILIDNGSSLNIMPMSTLKRLSVDISHMRRSHVVVRAFDGTRREVVGHIELSMEIGPCAYEIEFQVMDINPSYNCLLGRPWIHSAGAVPSSLHQKVKLVLDGRLISISGEEDIIASATMNGPYIGVPEEGVECSFRALEIVNATFVTEGKRIPRPCLSENTKTGLKQLVGKGCLAGFGLGKNLQGMNRAIQAVKKMDGAGLGYKATGLDRKKMLEERRKKRMARLEGREENNEPMYLPHLNESFRSAGFEHIGTEDVCQKFEQLSVNAIEETMKEAEKAGFPPCPSGFKNWQEFELPVVYKADKM